MSNKIIGYIIQCNTNNCKYYIGKKREIYFSSLGSKVKIFKSKNRTTKISSYYYKEKMIQNNKAILMFNVK